LKNWRNDLNDWLAVGNKRQKIKSKRQKTVGKRKVRLHRDVRLTRNKLTNQPINKSTAILSRLNAKKQDFLSLARQLQKKNSKQINSNV